MLSFILRFFSASSSSSSSPSPPTSAVEPADFTSLLACVRLCHVPFEQAWQALSNEPLLLGSPTYHAMLKSHLKNSLVPQRVPPPVVVATVIKPAAVTRGVIKPAVPSLAVAKAAIAATSKATSAAAKVAAPTPAVGMPRRDAYEEQGAVPTADAIMDAIIRHTCSLSQQH